MNKHSQTIHMLADKIQRPINQLHDREPNNITFEQEGILNGSLIVQEYLDEGECGLAVEHLLYMVYESEIFYPNEIIEELTDLANKYEIKSSYL